MVNDTKEVDTYLHRDDAVFIDELNDHAVKAMIHEMQQPHVNAGVFYNNSESELLTAFKKKFKIIQAAGGLVHAKNNLILLIFRKGKWDLPKGKLDDNESLETCAIREIKEETGLKEVKIEKPLLTTYHTYHEEKNFILKETHWFLMSAAKQKLSPQTEEGIDKCEWVSKKDLSPYLSNTYALVLDVLKKGLNIIVEED